MFFIQTMIQFKTMKKTITALSLLLGITLNVSVAQAATTPVPSSTPLPIPTQLIPIATTIPGTSNCFDYYHFGSVQADLPTDRATAAAGTTLTFKGEVVNSNSYPIVDGALYVKIFRVSTAEKNTAGPDVVDQFFVQKDINLPGQGKKPLEFTWQIPATTPSGNYELATFFVTAEKFNLLGLSFTDDVIGNITYFSVTSKQNKVVQFDKAAVTVNNQPYHFAAFPPRVDTPEVTITAPVSNPTDTTQTVPVTWQMYSWDALHDTNLLDTKEQTITINPKSTATATYTTTNADHPVYYIVATAHYQDTKSIIGVRFVRPKVARVRLNFPAVDHFPLQAGQPTTLFACVHGMGEDPVVKDNKLILSLQDAAGKVFHTYTYAGDITGAMMGVKDVVTPTETYQRFTLKAELYHAGQLVDEAQLNYDCSQLSPESCPTSTPSAPGRGARLDTSRQWRLVIAGLLLVLLAGGLTVVIIRKKKSPPTSL